MKRKDLSPLTGLLFLAFLFSPLKTPAQVFTSADLTAPMEENGVSARALALGSAYAAVPDDIAAMSFNPGALGTLSSFQLALDHQSWLDGFFQETLMASIPVPGLGTGGVGFNYLDHGTFSGRDTNGDPTADFRSYRLSGTLGWGMPLFEHFYLGIAGRGIQQTIAGESSQAFAMDGGALWEPLKGWTVGLSYMNWGTYISDFLLASRLRAATAYNFQLFPDQRALACLAFSREPYNDAQIHFGLEDCFSKLISLRAGYQLDLYDNQMTDLYGFSAGLGLHWEQFTLDYAFLPNGDLGSTQRVSLQYDFGAAQSEPTPTPVVPSPTPTVVPAVSTPTVIATSSSAGPTPTQTPSPDDTLTLYFKVPEDSGAVPLTNEMAVEMRKLSDHIKLVPRDAQAWMDLGRLYYQIGKKEWAIQCFDQVLRLEPGAQKLRDWLEKYKQSKP